MSSPFVVFRSQSEKIAYISVLEILCPTQDEIHQRERNKLGLASVMRGHDHSEAFPGEFQCSEFADPLGGSRY
jgi:hypothetical protein